jgi:hypothetical protein
VGSVIRDGNGWFLAAAHSFCATLYSCTYGGSLR